MLKYFIKDQHGFYRNSSVITNSNNFTDRITILTGNSVDGIYNGYRRAFDLDNIKLLSLKLRNNGVVGFIRNQLGGLSK